MKKVLFILTAVVIASITILAAAQQTKKYQATAVAMMQYDNNGEERGWTTWQSCNTVITASDNYFVFNADNFLFTQDMKFSFESNGEAYQTKNGRMGVAYAASDSQGTEAIISLDVNATTKGDMILIVETKQSTLGFKIKNPGTVTAPKGTAKKATAPKGTAKKAVKKGGRK